MNKLTISQRNAAQHIPIDSFNINPPNRKGRHIILRPLRHILLQTPLLISKKLNEIVVLHPRGRNFLVVIVDNVDDARLFEVTVLGNSGPAARVDARFGTSMRLAVEVSLP